MTAGVRIPLLAFALVVALGIKVSVQDDRQPSERVIDAHVTYNSPSTDIVSYDRVETVRVGLRGRSSAISALSMFNVEVVVDIPRGRPGATPITLSPANVNVPRDIEVISIEPNRFLIQVEPRITALKSIEVQLVGEPAAGARHGEPVVIPSWAEVSGPESRVRKLPELKVSISLEGHARTFEEQAVIVSPDSYVQVAEPTRVSVRVPMEEPELTISVEKLRDDEGIDTSDEGPAIGDPPSETGE